MYSMGIAWSSFTWEAFATLTAGIAAVLAALVVGLRQSKVLNRQTELQASGLKIGLFERRMDVFRAVEQLIYGAIGNGGPVSDSVEREFIKAKQEARFLFDVSMDQLFRDIWENYVKLKIYSGTMNDEFEKSGHYGQENIDQKYAAIRWLSECSDNLADRFKAINPSFGISRF